MFGIKFLDIAIYFFPIMFIALSISKIVLMGMEKNTKIYKILKNIRYSDIGILGLLACLVIFLRVLEIHTELDVYVWVLSISDWALFPLCLLLYCAARNFYRFLYVNKVISEENYVDGKKSVNKIFLIFDSLCVLILVLAIGLEYL